MSNRPLNKSDPCFIESSIFSIQYAATCFEYNNKVIIDNMYDKEIGWSKRYYNIIEKKYKMIKEKKIKDRIVVIVN